jgi:hypothetical protein
MRVSAPASPGLNAEYEDLLEAYDRAGLPFERALTRLSQARRLLSQGETAAAQRVAAEALDLARQYAMPILAADACALQALSASEG